MMKPGQVVKALSALAQPTRLAIYRLLVVTRTGRNGGWAGVGKTESVSGHAVVSFQGIEPCRIGGEQAGGAFHLLRCEHFAVMNGMVEYLTENCCGGDADACRVPGKNM